MCGIVSVIGKLDVKLEKAFNLMWSLDTIRGWHSSGLIGVKTYKQEVEYFKCLGTPFDAQKKCDLFTDLKSGYKGIYDVLIGHNRHATFGAINEENAHPFDFDNVIGVHNGTLNMYRSELDEDKHDVDSHTLYYNINKYGLKKALSKTRGAYALAFYDKGRHRVCFIRNKDRPLCYAFTEDKSAVLIASEPWIIMAAAYRYAIKLSNEGKPYYMLEDKMYWWDVKNLRLNENGDEVKFNCSRDKWEGLPENFTGKGGRTTGSSGNVINLRPENKVIRNRAKTLDWDAIKKEVEDRLEYLIDDEGYIPFTVDLKESPLEDLERYMKQPNIPIKIFGLHYNLHKIDARVVGGPDTPMREVLLTEVKEPVFFGKINSITIGSSLIQDSTGSYLKTTVYINIQSNSILEGVSFSRRDATAWLWPMQEEFNKDEPLIFPEDEEEGDGLEAVGDYFLSKKQVKNLTDTGCVSCTISVSEAYLKEKAKVFKEDDGQYSFLCNRCVDRVH